ncbi:MAG TPA: acyltransferase, partial [Burkholderiaceae bacterium]|nr:acyltransferase [Burkholderiaceae bacterium]
MLSPVAAGAVLCVLFLIAHLVARKSHFFSRQLEREAAASRFLALDGLRGLLALSVFVHHAAITQAFLHTGAWQTPPSRFYTNLGQGGVALFFATTAFLFWTKGLTSEHNFNMQILLWSRVCRLVPMYLVSALLALSIVATLTKFHLMQSIPTVVKQVLLVFAFGFAAPNEINGILNAWTLLFSVAWSLAYEWMFYLLLPLALLFSRGIGLVILLAAASVFIAAFSTSSVEWYFIAGIVSAAIIRRNPMKIVHFLRGHLAAALGIISLAVAIFGFDSAYGLQPAVPLFVFFLIIVGGNTLWGLLASRAARLLGMVSYSIYLLHSMVLFIFFRMTDGRALGIFAFWFAVAVAGIFIVLLSTLTYRVVEYPFLQRRYPDWLSGIGTRA